MQLTTHNTPLGHICLVHLHSFSNLEKILKYLFYFIIVPAYIRKFIHNLCSMKSIFQLLKNQVYWLKLMHFQIDISKCALKFQFMTWYIVSYIHISFRFHFSFLDILEIKQLFFALKLHRIYIYIRTFIFFFAWILTQKDNKP